MSGFILLWGGGRGDVINTRVWGCDLISLLRAKEPLDNTGLLLVALCFWGWEYTLQYTLRELYIYIYIYIHKHTHTHTHNIHVTACTQAGIIKHNHIDAIMFGFN